MHKMRRHESIILVFLVVAFYTAHFDALRLCAWPKTLQRKYQALHSTVQDSNYYNDKVVECRQNKVNFSVFCLICIGKLDFGS